MRKNSFLTTVAIWLGLMVVFVLLHFFYLLGHFTGANRVLITDPLLLLLLWALNHYFLKFKINFNLQLKFRQICQINSLPLILAFFFIITIISQQTYTAAHFIDSLWLALAAALFEEFFFRGILLNNFLAKSTNTYRNYLTAVFLSSFLFGLTHLVNLAVQSWAATLLQMANAFVLGIMLAALYLRTGKLGWPIFYHFILDFTGILLNGIVTKTPTAQSLKGSLVILLLYLLTGIFLLRKKLFSSWQR